VLLFAVAIWFFWPRSQPPPVLPACSIEPKTGFHSDIEREQARKLQALLLTRLTDASVNLSVEGSDKAQSQVDETYSVIGDKQQACALLLNAMLCAQRAEPSSPLAMKLADSVPRLCGSGEVGPSGPAQPNGASLTAPPGVTPLGPASVPPPPSKGAMAAGSGTKGSPSALSGSTDGIRQDITVDGAVTATDHGQTNVGVVRGKGLPNVDQKIKTGPVSATGSGTANVGVVELKGN
jgi:hypothetical protein